MGAHLSSDRRSWLSTVCGIYGRLTLSGSEIPNDAETARNGLDRIHHRGPDEGGEWQGDGVFLGSRRLSIIDIAGGCQPIWNEDNTLCIVYNGELYNFQELRREMESKGHRFQTRSDTEVVLHAYEEWGAECLRRFNGMFAFAIWSRRNRSLFLARDRIGEKPLYYFRDGQRLVFGSEIKSIVADPTIPRELNLKGLVNFLAFNHAVAPETIYRSIFKLLPGHFLIACGDDLRVVQYWDVGDEAPAVERGMSEEEHAGQVLKLLDDSVRRRMVADVPVGAFLSGGVDSSAVVALMRRHASGPIKTFSLGFAIGGAYNELSDARRVAEFLGTEHHELNVQHVDLVDTLWKLVYHYDEPFGDPAGFPVYLLSRYARKYVKVVLAGDGGDELFGGYRRYAADQFSSLYQGLPGAFTRNFLPSLAEKLPRLRRIKRTLQTLPLSDPARRYASWLEVFTPDLRSALLQPHLLNEIDGYDPMWPYPHYYWRLSGGTASDHLNRVMYVDVKTWLADAFMEKIDKATMACSLEARLPILDHRLVEYAFQIPGHHKIRGWSTKRVFKHAVRDLLPSGVLQKRKHGFAVPTDPWFRGELKEFMFDILMDHQTQSRGFFNKEVVERLWREHVSGRHVWDAQLWLLLNFELWARTYLDQPAALDSVPTAGVSV